MKTTRHLVLALLLVAIPATVIYATRLGFAPIYLMHDEVNYSLQAVSVAGTGRDLNGRLLPVYFSEPAFPAGRDPMMIYATAIAVVMLPISEAVVRLPTALAGVATILLTLVLAARIFNSVWVGAVAAGMLALTPALFIHSRLALAVIYPLPFVIAWLVCLRRFETGGDRRALLAGGIMLGLSVYAYLAALLMLPVYVVLTAWYLRASGQTRSAAWLVGGVAAALVPMLLWQVAYPDRYVDLLQSYQPGAASAQRTVPSLDSIADVLRFRLHQWWVYFDPAYLFLTGDTSMTNSTRNAGCFPLAFVALLPLGIHHLWRRGGFGRLLIAGFATAPLAAILTGTVDLNRYRALFVLPFGALLAAAGFEWLWQSRRRIWRAAAVFLLITIAAQFWLFYRDYMGPYRESSSTWFGRNVRAAFVEVLDGRAGNASVFLSNRIPYAPEYRRFYAQSREVDVVPVVVDGQVRAMTDAVDGSWLVALAGEPWLAALPDARWQFVKNVVEPSGEISFALYRKMPAP